MKGDWFEGPVLSLENRYQPLVSTVKILPVSVRGFLEEAILLIDNTTMVKQEQNYNTDVA